MQNEENYLQAIQAEPDNGILRLAYADWLEACEDPRGEFIRVQIALAQGGGDVAALRQREQEILENHRQEWLAPLMNFGSDWQFERGFVGKGTIPAKVFLDQSEAIFRSAPLLNSIRFTGVRECRGFFNRHVLNRLTAIDLSGQQIDEEGRDWYGLRLDALRSLNLSGTRIDPKVFFDKFPDFPSLTDLDLSRCGLEDLRCLEVSYPALVPVRHLNLSNNEIFWMGLPEIECLQTLDLSHNHLDSPAAADLFESSVFENLTFLNLAYNCIKGELPKWTGAPMARILESSLFGKLAHLDLSGNPIGEDGFWHFFNCAMIDKYGERWYVERGSEWVTVYSADGRGGTDYASGKVAVPQKLILRDTGLDDYYRQLLLEEYGDNIVL